MAAEHRALLAQQSKTHPAAVQAANKKAIKTEEGAGKTIDYTLYNYGTAGVLGSLGGSAVLSLTKDASTNLNFNDTQASTIAALGNAALILGGALLFGQLNNRIQARAQHNLYSRGFKGHATMFLNQLLRPH